MKLKILIVDDHCVVRTGLKLLLDESNSFEVIGEAENGNIALSMIEKMSPDVILMDLNMPVMDGVATLKKIREKRIDIPVIIITAYNEDKLIARAIELGAKGYLLKDASSNQIINTIETALNENMLLIDERIISSMFQNKKKEMSVANNNTLTDKQIDVLKSIAKGLTSKAISINMGISERTVKSYLTDIYIKLGANSRSEAVSIAMKKNII